MFIDTLTSKFRVSYLGGRYKFDEVVLQAMGSFSMCTGFHIVMVSMAFLGHINVMVFAGAASGVVRIQTSGATWIGKFTPDAFPICNEYCEVISTVLIAYRTAIQDGGFVKAEKVWLSYRIDHLLLSRLETW